MLRTRVWDEQRGAKESSPLLPHELKELAFHLVKRLVALATDLTASLNQPRRPWNHIADGRARRTRAKS